MGRLVLRAGWGVDGLDFVRVNDVGCDAATSAHLLQFDSVHGIWPRECTGETRGSVFRVDDQALAYTSEPEIEAVDWTDCDIVVEATGVHHKTPEKLARYLEAGAKKVLIAAPTEGVLNLVYGVNHELYDPNVHDILTAASCTTNCLAPVVKVMHEGIGIERGTMTTIHDLTNTQTIVDKGQRIYDVREQVRSI